MSSSKSDVPESISMDFISALLSKNCKDMDQHWEWIKTQAQRSFWLAAAACAGAAILISTGAVSLILTRAIAVPTIIISTGILVALLGALFFYQYHRFAMKIADYRQKLALAQNVNLALKTAEGLPDNEGAIAKKDLVKELLDNINKLLVSER